MYKVGFIGGHFTTAESVIEELLIGGGRQIPSSEIVFFGKKREAGEVSVEFQEISKLGIKFIEVKANKINRFLTIRNIFSVILLPISIIYSLFLLLKYRPKVLIGFGGYLQIPLMLAGKLLGIKLIIHEGTVFAGFANRFISHFADRVLISFGSSRIFFKKPQLVGCPLRKSIIEAARVSGKLPVLLISGGHLGSKKINAAIFPILNELLKIFLVIHQVGSYDFELANRKKQELESDLRYKYVLKKFFSKEEYSRILASANLLIARGGVNTVCEVIYLKIPSIFIPLKFAQKNEQMENARLAEKIGLSQILEEKDLNYKSLREKINKISALDVSQVDNSKEKEILANSASKIANVIYEYIL
jgi:UDP-N-acetylglucosamine--N-acetylmuramyl-(pentapeptide) pyrophosphoryl-undecaprenol N-acetylglucosamine transferase